MQAFSPNGTLIVGTKELIPGRAEISLGSFERGKNGQLVFDYEGSTEVFWNDQETVQLNGKDIYLDEDGEEWTEDQITLREEEDTPLEEKL